jgi:hypothetical protein
VTEAFLLNASPQNTPASSFRVGPAAPTPKAPSQYNGHWPPAQTGLDKSADRTTAALTTPPGQVRAAPPSVAPARTDSKQLEIPESPPRALTPTRLNGHSWPSAGNHTAVQPAPYTSPDTFAPDGTLPLLPTREDWLRTEGEVVTILAGSRAAVTSAVAALVARSAAQAATNFAIVGIGITITALSK